MWWGEGALGSAAGRALMADLSWRPPPHSVRRARGAPGLAVLTLSPGARRELWSHGDGRRRLAVGRRGPAPALPHPPSIGCRAPRQLGA